MIINKLNEEIKLVTLSNGLKVYIYHNPEFTSMYANYTVNFGSIDTNYTFEGQEYSDPKGIAHYLEHLMFADGSNDYFDYFSQLGASSNAYTSFNQTSYLFSSSSNYDQNLKYLIEMVQTLNIDEARVESEFGVIKEEIEMYNSKPNFVLQNMLFSSTFTSNYKYDIAGSVQSIGEITYEHIKRLFDMFYAPSNATLFIASNEEIDINYLESIQLITENKPHPEHRREVEKLEVNSTFNHEYSDVASDPQAMVSLKFPVAKNTKEIILADIAFEILTIWLTSDLNSGYGQAIDDEIINETFTGYHMADQTLNAMVFKMRSSNTDNIISYITEQMKTIDFEMIDIIKRKKIGSEIRLFNSPENICEYGLDLVLRDIDMNDYFDYLYEISSQEIMSYIESMMEQNVKSIQVLSKKEGEQCVQK